MFYEADKGGGSGGGDSLLNTPPPPVTPPSTPPTTPPATPPSTLKFSEIVAENGDFKPGWQDLLPDDLKVEASLKNFHQFPALVKSLVHAQKAVGKDKVTLPGEHATADEVNEFYTKLGRPVKPDDYKFQAPEKLPEGVTWDSTGNKAFAEKAHELGLSSKQAEALYAWHSGIQLERLNSMPQALEQQRAEAETELKKEWGAAFNQQLVLAQRAANTYGALEDFERLGIGNNPAVLKFLAKVGASISEDKLKGGAQSALVPGDAKSQINEIKGDTKHPYNNAEHPAHAQEVAKMAKLYEMAYPSA